MMSTEPIMGFAELEDIVGDLEIPCDYDADFSCGPAAARWVFTVKCQVCGLHAQRLSCGGCKSIWMSSEDGAECPRCEEVYVPARRAFARVEWLK